MVKRRWDWLFDVFYFFFFLIVLYDKKKEEEKQKDENADQVFDVFENELKIQKIKSSENEG